jgi:hypothetical protein
VTGTHVTRLLKRKWPMNGGWEPIFISDKEAPIYEERLSWEGRKDKMSQVSYEA